MGNCKWWRVSTHHRAEPIDGLPAYTLVTSILAVVSLMHRFFLCAQACAIAAVTAFAPSVAARAQGVLGPPRETSARYELFGNYLVIHAAPGVDNEIVLHGGDPYGVVKVYDFADTVSEPDTFSTTGANGVKRISVDAGDGNDKVSNLTYLPSTLQGGPGSDILNGSGSHDYLNGGTGNDLLSGGSGGDRLIGGSGNDRLHGDYGDDSLDGGIGYDSARGGAGIDTCRASEVVSECE
ncbi:calcium-binding protein [Streptomyces naphthomycinicus]|uniref:calcium-binding protein n=1 Tax=Streptomyces naphthomycinicus TaxID=2872625 RepID=UPI001CED964D|nr:calcium-binding protein [Streptomyces sp. TML10]